MEPTGFLWEQHMMATIAASVCNAIYDTIPTPKGKPRPRRLKPSDFYISRKK